MRSARHGGTPCRACRPRARGGHVLAALRALRSPMPDTAPTRQCVVEMGRLKREPRNTIMAELISTTNPAAGQGARGRGPEGGGEQGARCWQSCARNHARLQEPGQQAGQGLRVARQQAEHRRRAARPRAAAAPRECERRHIFTPRMRMIL